MSVLKKVAAGASLALLAGAEFVSAQTTTPGTPDTGAGGDFLFNLILLGVAALVAAAGLVYMLRRAE